MNKGIGLALVVAAALALPASAAATTVTAEPNVGEFGREIAGSGVDLSSLGTSAQISGGPAGADAFGLFSGAPAGLGMSSGAVLTTGDRDMMLTSSDFPAQPALWSVNAPDGQLDADWSTTQASGSEFVGPVSDLTRLTLVVKPAGTKLSVNYVFGSEEFGQASEYNDGALILVDSQYTGNPANPADKNCAVLPNGQPVTVGGVDQTANWFSADASGAVTGMSGRTTLQTCTVNVIPGELVSLRFVVFDRTDNLNDSGNDSALMLATDSLTSDAVPSAALSATPASGPAPLDVSFSTAGTSDFEGPLASWALSFGDGTASRTGNGNPPAAIAHRYAVPGSYTATLAVEDSTGQEAQVSDEVSVGPAIDTDPPGGDGTDQPSAECLEAKAALAEAKKKLKKAKAALSKALEGENEAKIKKARRKVKRLKRVVKKRKALVAEACG